MLLCEKIVRQKIYDPLFLFIYCTSKETVNLIYFMNVLHLTDFHYSGKSKTKYDESKVVSSIIDQVKKLDIIPDLIIFSGDLTFSGSKLDDFRNAYQLFFVPLLKTLNLPKENLFFCPGNHDIDRSKVSTAIIDLIDKFQSNKELESFFSKPTMDSKYVMEPLNNYNTFIDETFTNGKDDFISERYTCHKRLINGKQIGVFCGNTAIRAVGSQDEGNLILCPSDLKEGMNFIKGCDFKIFIHHHPLNQLKLYNSYEVEDFVHNNFNVSFSGHLHKEKTSVVFTHNDGILKISTAASLAEKDGSTIGFSIFMFDLNDSIVMGENYTYNLTGEFFYKNNEINASIPISQEKLKQNKFRKTINELYEIELEEADDLFLSGKSVKDNKRFSDYWTDPIINEKSSEEVKKDKSAQHKLWIYEDILNTQKNIIIIGDDKCGKTSFLKKIQLECLRDFTKYEILPYYLNLKRFDLNENIPRLYSKYFRTSANGALEILNDRKNLLLIDNFVVNSENVDWLTSVIRHFKNIKLIICAKQDSLSKYTNISINDEPLLQLFFHDLKKRQLKELAGKFYLEEDTRIEVINRIHHIFNMLAIPFNFWNVSLFLWVFKENSKDISNDVDLVDLYVESILERERLIKNKSNFSYDKYKQYLANLSKFLLSKHQHGYKATLSQIFTFTDEYLSLNPRNTITTAQIWDYVNQRGILKDDGEGNYSFRLNGIFEYFLAHYLKLDPEFRDEIINDDNVYLSFKNELQLYAGSNRGDEDFLNKIFKKTKGIFDQCLNDFEFESIDEHLENETKNSLERLIEKEDLKLIAESISEEDIDDFAEGQNESSISRITNKSEVKVKEIIPIDKSDILSLENALFILGRTFKNADDIKNTTLINEVFDYIIFTSIKWGYKLFDTFKETNISHELAKSNAEKFLMLMQQMLPLIVQSRVSDMIGANNMDGIIRKRIKELETKTSENQFVYFVLLFLLGDIDLSKNIEEILSNAVKFKMPVIRYAILMKVIYYYHLKAADIETSKRNRVDETLKELYLQVGVSFNNKIYNDGSVARIFQRLDSERIKDKKRLS